MLVRWGMEKAAAERKQVFIIASPEGKQLYEALGFEVVGDVMEMGGIPHHSMLWTPQLMRPEVNIR